MRDDLPLDAVSYGVPRLVAAGLVTTGIDEDGLWFLPTDDAWALFAGRDHQGDDRGDGRRRLPTARGGASSALGIGTLRPSVVPRQAGRNTTPVSANAQDRR